MKINQISAIEDCKFMNKIEDNKPNTDQVYSFLSDEFKGNID